MKNRISEDRAEIDDVISTHQYRRRINMAVGEGTRAVAVEPSRRVNVSTYGSTALLGTSRQLIAFARTFLVAHTGRKRLMIISINVTSAACILMRRQRRY